MKTKVLILAIGILISSCAKMPIQSVDLMTSIQNEGKRMHLMNLSFSNKLFDEKKNQIDEFIRNEYIPKFLEEFTKRIPDTVDVKTELPHILNYIIPQITWRRDSMQNALELSRNKVIQKLDGDYRDYEIACIELRKLLESAVKVEDERKMLLNQASALSKGIIDFNQLEIIIDQFIMGSGDWGQRIQILNENIEKLLNK